MITQGSFAAISGNWQVQLSSVYPQNEIAAMFRIVLEDIFGLGKPEQIASKGLIQSKQIQEKLEVILNRLITGEPLQHITGFTYFDGLKIKVSTAVLIPRPTEELVYEIVKVLPKDFSGTIIDWCTGSGCIALALKNHFPGATVKAYDLSGEALEIAWENARNLGLDVRFEQKDALGPDIETGLANVIVSNPPYIPVSEKSSMHLNVTGFEPGMALFVPDNEALLFYEAITQKADSDLSPGGFLFFELHENYAEETKDMVAATGRFETVEIIHDLQGKSRMLKAKHDAGLSAG